MFSHEARCSYQFNQLGDVICQLRFPEILSISANLPAAFQDMIRDEYPQYSVKDAPALPRLVGAPGNLTLQNQAPVKTYFFASSDGRWKVSLSGKSIALTCSKYTSWEEFAGKLDKPLAAFIKTYQPAFFDRVGLRYLNFISRWELGLEGVPFRDLIQPCYLGILAEEDVPEQLTTRSSVDVELNIRGGCKAKIHAGPGFVKRPGVNDKEVKFIFDQDLYMEGKLPLNLSAGALQTLHSQADSIFRGAITPQLHRAMEPSIID